MKLTILLSSLILLSACTWVNDSDRCETSLFKLEADFHGARLGQCTVQADNHIVVLNSPEDQPINHSPWYGFRLTGTGSVVVTIQYEIHKHRYAPKVSSDGIAWQLLDEDSVKVAEDKKSVQLRFELNGEELYVSAQENLSSELHLSWIESLESTYSLTRQIAGNSVLGKPIWQLETNPAAQNVVVLLGRQHPPEVTGALGMQHFVEKLLEASRGQHKSFFEKVNVVIFPLINPDGVDAGYWRHGFGHLDLNRDWGPFTQPETQAVKSSIDQLDEQGRKFLLMLDFHSTNRNVFYTQSEEEPTTPEGFTERWLASAKGAGVYEFDIAPRHNKGRPTSKNYFYERFNIPAITYEVGDATNRDEIRTSAEAFAEAMITELSKSL